MNYFSATGSRVVPNFGGLHFHHHQLELLPVAEQGPGAEGGEIGGERVPDRSDCHGYPQ